MISRKKRAQVKKEAGAAGHFSSGCLFFRPYFHTVSMYFSIFFCEEIKKMGEIEKT
jgi:hypothetical protein